MSFEVGDVSLEEVGSSKCETVREVREESRSGESEG